MSNITTLSEITVTPGNDMATSYIQPSKNNFNISELLYSFKDLARPNRFDVFIPIPVALLSYYSGGARDLSFRCDQAELPSRTLATADRKIGSVPVQKFPYLSTYNDLTLTFLVGGDDNFIKSFC